MIEHCHKRWQIRREAEACSLRFLENGAAIPASSASFRFPRQWGITIAEFPIRQIVLQRHATIFSPLPSLCFSSSSSGWEHRPRRGEEKRPNLPASVPDVWETGDNLVYTGDRSLLHVCFFPLVFLNAENERERSISSNSDKSVRISQIRMFKLNYFLENEIDAASISVWRSN